MILGSLKGKILSITDLLMILEPASSATCIKEQEKSKGEGWNSESMRADRDTIHGVEMSTKDKPFSSAPKNPIDNIVNPYRFSIDLLR